MKTKIKNSLQQNKVILFTSISVILAGAAACILGDIALPLIIGTLSALFLYDTTKKHLCSILISVALVALNTTAYILGLSASAFSLAAIAISYLISVAFKKGQSKSDTAYLSTLICAAFTVLASIVFAMMQQGIYTLDAAVEYYKGINDLIKSMFLEYMAQIYQMSGEQFVLDDFAMIYDQGVAMLLSYLFIGGFVTVGLGMKLFGAIVKKCADEPKHIMDWRFNANRVYAYFYVALLIASLFIQSADSVFAIAVLNLYNIFAIVFAYIGFRITLETMRARRRSRFSLILLILGSLFFFTFAVDIFAFFGVFYSFRRIGPQQGEGN